MPEVLEKVWAYRDAGNISGGSLHIVLDDGNIDRQDIEYCIQEAKSDGDKEGAEIGETLLLMSKTQRKKVAARFYDR